MRTGKRRAAALALALLIFVQGCEAGPRETREETMPKDTLSFLALGDSYTIGESVEPRERWPVLLAERLRGEGLVVRDPVIVARTGWTTDELAQGIEEADIRGTFDLVTLLIGVNNQYRGRPVEEYRTQFRALLSSSLAFAGGEAERVVVLSIPDWGVTPFAEGGDRSPDRIGREIDEFNEAARNECETEGVPFVDITPVSREAVRNHGLLAEDGLHPSGAMYGRWVEMVLPVVREIPGFGGGA